MQPRHARQGPLIRPGVTPYSGLQPEISTDASSLEPPGPPVDPTRPNETGPRPPAQGRPLVSFLIATRNRPDPLRRCLDSILLQQLSDYEVIVVDDHSDSGLQGDALEPWARDGRIRFIRHERPLGVVGARNRLMVEARGEFLLFLDDDAYFADSEGAARTVEALRSDPQVGIVAGKIVDHNGPHTQVLVPMAKRFRRRDPTLEDRRMLVSYFVGGFHAFRRSFIEECGTYQQDLVFGEEELDLSFRAIQGGYKILYLPTVVVHHVQQPSVLGAPGERRAKELYYMVRNRFYLAYRYLPWHSAVVFLFLWMGFLGWQAARFGFLSSYMGGLAAGINGIGSWRRRPLAPAQTAYLRKNYGRLWY